MPIGRTYKVQYDFKGFWGTDSEVRKIICTRHVGEGELAYMLDEDVNKHMQVTEKC